MSRLPLPQIIAIATAAQQCQLDRNVLANALGPTVAGMLWTANTPGAQLLSDLIKLNSLQLTDGTDPLHGWLLVADGMTQGRVENQVFKDALAALPPVASPVESPVISPVVQPSPAVTPSAARLKAIEDFILSAFSASELRRLVNYLPTGNVLSTQLPGETASLSELVTRLVELLTQRGELNDAFFAALVEARPARADEINALRNP